MASFLYEFEWDPVKAKANLNKHGVYFERATQVFRDPLALTVPDEEHSETEVRWVTLGRDASGQFVLVPHLRAVERGTRTRPIDFSTTANEGGSSRL